MSTIPLIALIGISVLMLGAIASPSILIQTADALKGQGVPSGQYGVVTQDKVCGGKLCSEVKEDQIKEENYKTLQERIQEKKEELRKIAIAKSMELGLDSNMQSNIGTEIQDKINPKSKIISLIPTSIENTYSVVFQVCAGEKTLRAPHVLISSDSQVKDIKLSKSIITLACRITAAPINALDQTTIDVKIIDQSKINEFITQVEEKQANIKLEISLLNAELDELLKSIPGNTPTKSENIKKINEMSLKLSELRKQLKIVEEEYLALLFIVK